MIIAKTPLRISLFGGGTDFPDYFRNNFGQVLSTTINKYTYVLLNKRSFDNKIRLGYSQTELVNSIDELNHELAREAIRKFNLSGIEMSTISDVPGGVGLATSSSILTGMLNALAIYSDQSFSLDDLINWTIDIEVNKLNKPIGYQDQVIVGKGGFQNILFSNEFYKDKGYKIENHCISQKTIDALEESLIMFFIGGQRQSSEILDEQNKNTKKNIRNLQSIYEICDEAVSALERDQPYLIGSLLDESWELKRSLASKISNDFIDSIYKDAMNRGAYGGKLLGAGGSGFMLFQVNPQDQKDFIYHLSEKFNIGHYPFRFEKHGSRIIFNNE